MTDTALVNQATFEQWLSDKQKPEAVEAELQAKGFTSESIQANLKEYKRRAQNKRNFLGFMYMGIGAFIGFISCVLAILNLWPQWHNFFLFGVTSIGVLLVFKGLYLVFE